MNEKKIGNFNVHPIGIGTWAIGGWYEPNYANDAREVKAIRYGLDRGQNHIDTAEMYANGHSEEVVGKAIKGYDRKKLFIASKVYTYHKTKKDIIFAVEKMLTRLKTDYLDLVYIHNPQNVSPLEIYIEGLNEAVDKHLLNYIGVSKFDLTLLKKTLRLSKYPIVAVQNLYNVADKQFTDNLFLEFCLKNHIAVVAHSPLANCTRLKLVIQMAEKYKKTPYQIAINWLISQENVMTIPKSVDTHHIMENLGALDFKLTKKEIESLG